MITSERKPVNRKEKNQGMNWISQHKRLAIYLRDGLSCVYCGSSVEDGVILSLDHLKCHVNGGTNKETNLVTSCKKCNSARGSRSVRSFCQGVAGYIEADAKNIEKHVRNCAKRDLKKHLGRAKELVTLRGSCAKAIDHLVN